MKRPGWMVMAMLVGVSVAGMNRLHANEGTVSTPISAPAPAKVKYKSGKELRFDELLIQGRMKRAEMSVVTGDPSELSDGLLRLRENFLDHAAVDLGEEVQQ